MIVALKKKLAVIFIMILLLVIFHQTEMAVYADTSTLDYESADIGASWLMHIYGHRQNNTWDDSSSANSIYGETDSSRWNNNTWALVEKQGEDSYLVTIQYHTYGYHEMIQLAGPESIDAIETAYSKPKQIPLGMFDMPESFRNEENVETDIADGYLSEEANDYYRSSDQVQIYQKDSDQDLGVAYLSFELENPEQFFLINTYVSDYFSQDGRKCTCLMNLETDNVISLPEGLSWEVGSYTKGFCWSNYVKGNLTYASREEGEAEALSDLNNLFESEVQMSVDESGAIQAVFTVVQDEDDPVTSVKLAVSRDYSWGMTNGRNNQEWYGTEYTEVYDSESGTVTLDVDDLVFGSWMSVSTQSMDEYNQTLTDQGYSETYYLRKILLGCLRLCDEITEDREFTLESNGAILTSSTASMDEDSEFAWERISEDETTIEAATIKNIAGFSRGGDSYEIWRLSLTKDGENVVPLYPVTVTLPVPEGMSVETLSVTRKDGQRITGEWSNIGTLDEDSRTLIVTPNVNYINADYVFYDRGEVLQESELAELEEGLYRVQVTTSHASVTYKYSMSNAAFADNTGYLEVLSKGSDYRLYVEMQPVYVAGSEGYMSAVHYYEGSDNSTREEAEYLSYHVWDEGTEDETTVYSDWEETYHLQYPRRLSMPLQEALSDGSYQVSFIIPVMDSFSGTPGDGSALAYANLRLTEGTLEEVVDGVNPLAGYDKSVLLALITETEWYLATLEDGEEKDALETALETAKAAYEEDLTEEELLAAVAALQQALEDAGGGSDPEQTLTDGVYTVPLTVYNSDLDTESGRKDYFGETAGVTVSGSEMEIVLSMQEVNGDTVTGLYYLDEASGEYEEAEPTLAEDGSVESFLLNLAYTEERIGIYFVTEKYTYETYADLWLDLANAEKEMASDESVQALESRIEEIRAWDSADYTAASWEALMQAVEEVEVVLEANTGSYTLALITAQSAKLEAAVSALVDLTELRIWIETAEALDEDNYREASYAALTEAVETAAGVLNQEDATGDEILEQVTALKAAIRGLLAVDHLADGQYSLPFTYWKQTSTSSNNKVMVNVTEAVDVIVDGDQMTVILTMREHPTGAKWATACYYNPEGTTEIADEWSAEATQTDEDGHITEFRYTMDYTEEWIPMFMIYNNVYQSGYLDMDFDSATVTALKGDASELTALAESAAGLEENAYTTDSWAAFTEVLTAAEAVLAKEMPEQEELDEQTALLQAAIEALIARGDTTALEEQIAKAEQYLEETGTYQKSSLADLEEVISEIRAALESADNLSQEDVDALAETLQVAVDALEERLLQDGTYTVPVTVYDAGEDTVSVLQGYFDTAQITLDGEEMQVTLYTQEVDGDTVTELFYYDGTEYRSAEAGSDCFTFTVEYTDERLEIYILTDNRNYASYLDVSLEEESATEEEASEEAVEALRESMAQAAALAEADYTAASWANLTAVIAGIEETLASQENFTENEVSRLGSQLAEAVSALVDLTELRTWIGTAQSVDAEKYRETSYASLTEALEAAAEVLDREDATGDEVLEQVTALKAAIRGLLTVDQLADGQYSLPFTYWKQTNTSSNNKVMINVTEAVDLVVDGDQMTVILTMREHPTGAKWATACYYNPEGTTEIADEWSAEATQTDEDGHITEFRYTMDYTEEWIPMFMIYNNVYQSGYLDMDFDSATVTVLKGDAAELTALVESVAGLEESVYTADSWAAFAEALAAAETVLAEEMPEQEELDEQTALLQAAIDALVAKGDPAALQARIGQAQALAREDYTTESWENLTEALAAAVELLADADNLGQSEMDEAEENLTSAIAALELRGDTSALEALITGAEAYLSGSYTEESLANLSEVLATVKSAIEDTENLTADQVAELEQQLQEAIDSLEAEKTESTAQYKLRILIESCYYEEEDYTEETWSVYAEALANAEEVYADSSKTDDDYREAYTALLEAIDQLKEYDEASEALAEWVALAEELKETIGETNSGYEETSWAAYVAALSMADEDNPYSLTETQIRSQIAWLEWESEALILLSDLESGTSTGTASVASLIWDTYEENAISVASEDDGIALINDLEEEEEETEEEIEEETSVSSESTTTKTNVSSETETSAGTAASVETEAAETTAVETETQAETEESAGTEADEKTKAESETENETESETEIKAETAAAVETEEETEAEKETETQSEAEEAKEKDTEQETEADEEDDEQEADEIKLSRSRSRLSLFRLGSSLASSSDVETASETAVTKGSTTTSSSSKTSVSGSSGTTSTSTTATTAATATTASTASVASTDDDPDDGTYTVNYALYKYDEEKTSMGNPAFVKPATVIIKDGESTVYMELQGMTYTSLYGHLLSIQIMSNLVTDSDGVIESYKLVDPVYVVYTDETDDYGPPAGEQYPQIVGLEIPLYQTNTPVLVNVPVMGSSAEQPARLRVYWDTLTYQSASTNIDGSIDVTEPDDTETETLDYDALNDAIDAFDEATDDTSVWLSASYYAALKSRTAGKTLLTLSGATQTMVDERTTALNLAVNALVPVATDDERAELEAKIEEAESYSISDYTEDSYENLAQAVIDADKLLMETDITSGMVAKQIKALDRAINALVEDTSTDVKTTELELWISTVKSYLVSDDYTTASKSDLIEALYEAVEVLANQDATQDEVDAQVKALKAAVSALEKAVDKSTLYDLLAEAWTYSSDDYTTDSYSDLVEALAVATFVYKDTSATSDTVSLAAAELQAAILNLVSTTSDESSTASSAEELLYSWMQVAVGYSSGDYTEDSYAELATALASARQVYVSTTATSAEKKAAALDIQTAINGLVAVSDSSSGSTGSSSSVSTDEAYYTVKVRLWHSTLNKSSMGDSAVVSKAYVHVDGDQTTMRLLTKRMTVSGITAHLHDFWIYDGTDYEEAELISTENSRWIYEFELPDNSSTYYKCKVDPQVDVMGDDPVKARLKVSWTSLDEVDQDDWDDLEGDTDDEDESNTYSGYTSGSNYSTELVHEETGIRVKGNTGGPGVVLMAEKKESGDDYDRATRVLAGVAERFVVYDIKLRSGENTVQPMAAVTLRIPIPADYDVSKLVLYRINDDGTTDRIEGAVNGLYYEASVEHFSIYTLIESNAAQSVSAPVSTGSTGGNSTARNTGNTSGTKSSSGSGSGSAKNLAAAAVADVMAESGSASGQMVAGRVIPYTGDRMPVKELAGLAALSLLIFAGTTVGDRKQKKR